MFLNLQSSPTKPPIELKETFKFDIDGVGL